MNLMNPIKRKIKISIFILLTRLPFPSHQAVRVNFYLNILMYVNSTNNKSIQFDTGLNFSSPVNSTQRVPVQCPLLLKVWVLYIQVLCHSLTNHIYIWCFHLKYVFVTNNTRMNVLVLSTVLQELHSICIMIKDENAKWSIMSYIHTYWLYK